jgi:hypothetical protein
LPDGSTLGEVVGNIARIGRERQGALAKPLDRRELDDGKRLAARFS